MAPHRKGSRSAAVALALSVTFVLAALGILPFPAITVQWLSAHHEDSMQYTPSITGPMEREFVLVYFGSAACWWCNNPDLAGVVDSAMVAVREHAAAHGASFSAMGIAIDWDTRDGVDHLAKVDHFDDIAMGRSKYGLGARTYLHLMDGTPQVSVLERTASKLDEVVAQRIEEKELIR